MAGARLLNPDDLDPAERSFYRDVLIALAQAEVPYLVGGGYALRSYTGIVRDTKDIDVFVLPADAERALAALAALGYETNMKFPHWLGKARQGDLFVDVIFSSGNGLCEVDAEWFFHAPEAAVLDVPVRLCPVEEMIWQKAFIMERHRFDGADVVHLLHCCGAGLDWPRLLRRFGEHWPLLLSHLIVARYSYPADQSPAAGITLSALVAQLKEEIEQAPRENGQPSQVCRGTLLSLLEYLPAVQEWGYRDARLPPTGTMTRGEIAHWTASFER